MSVNILCFLLYHISQYIFTQNRNSLLPDPGIGINTISSDLIKSITLLLPLFNLQQPV